MAKRSDQEALEIEAQAAAWVARLGYEARSPVDEAAFRTWLAEDPRHREAFDQASATWQLGSTLRRTSFRGLDLHRAPPRSWDRRAAMGVGFAAAAGLAGVAVLAPLLHEQHFTTEVGEQRRIALAGGLKDPG